MKTQFIYYAENLKLEVESHPSDVNFLIIKNCCEKQGQELCKKFKASGSACGKNGEHYKIGNFGKYN
jgi:hypothetical protein